MKKGYRPYHIIIFVASCLALMGIIPLLLPSGTLKIGSYDFRFISEAKLLKNKVQKKVNVNSLIAEIDTSEIEAKYDSLANKQILGAAGVANYRISQSNLLDYNEEGSKSLIQLFNALHQSEKKKMRILHYGDSQIEGDRMTSFLRQRLQEQFGGNGPGFIPAVNVYNTISYAESYSSNFIRLTNFGGKSLKGNNYGILNSAGRFADETGNIYFKDTANANSKKWVKGWLKIEAGKMAYSRARKYNNVYLHYTEAMKHCTIKVFQNGNLILTDSLKSDGKYHIYPLNFPGNPGSLTLEFDMLESPTILGLSLEGDIGVQVDNIGMRGSSGTFFGRINQSLARRIYNDQNVELFIMQFGGNSVPYIKDSSSARQHANYFKGQLYTIKKLRPQAAIIVIGPSDMSTLIDGEYTTYPILPYYVECMRKATKAVGGAYFDMYAAMGGYGSMVAWVESGLAGNDYIHFSNKGASIAAQKFYDALMTAYTKLMTHE